MAVIRPFECVRPAEKVADRVAALPYDVYDSKEARAEVAREPLSFLKIDSSVKKNCKNQNDIKTYFFMFQGFCNDLFNLLGNLMQWKFRFSMLVKKLLYNMTTKTVHEILTKSEWKDISVQKAAWSVRKYAEKLGYSEQWITDFVYNVVLLAKEDQKKELKKNKEA